MRPMHYPLPTALACVSVFMLTACTRAPVEAPVQNQPATEVIERAVKAAAALGDSLVEMQQTDVALIEASQPPLSATEEKRYATHTRLPQADGSLMLTDRVHGHYEYQAPNRMWYTLTRIGGDAHVNITFSDGESVYSFYTRFPDSISRTPVTAEDELDNSTMLGWMAKTLSEQSKRATAVRLRGREMTQGVLCDVIDLDLPADKQADEASPPGGHITYYVGVADGLIHRTVEQSGPAGRHAYQELLFRIDPAFKAQDLSYARFETAVKNLLKDQPLPPVVVKMQ